MRNQKTAEDYRTLAANCGIQWLGPEVSRNDRKTWWRCAGGHEWESTYQNVRRSGRCPQCFHQNNAVSRRLKSEDYKALALEREIEWLGPEVSRNDEKTWWRCAHGHEWQTRYDVIKDGAGCPTCSRERQWEQFRLTVSDYTELAHERGYVWIGQRPRRSDLKTAWKCQKGHEWDCSYDDMRKGRKCPECLDWVNGRPASRPQRALCEMVGGTLNQRVGRMHVDVVVKINDVSLALEYDGGYWHRDKTETDRKRSRALIGKGWKVLRVKSNNLLPAKEELDHAIQRLIGGEDYIEIVLPDWPA